MSPNEVVDFICESGEDSCCWYNVSEMIFREVFYLIGSFENSSLLKSTSNFLFSVPDQHSDSLLFKDFL